jgi:hypothetical protein
VFLHEEAFGWFLFIPSLQAPNDTGAYTSFTLAVHDQLIMTIYKLNDIVKLGKAPTHCIQNSMADNAKEHKDVLLSRRRNVIELIDFFQEDPDHVLRRRFGRLHLYNLYSKHNNLLDIDKDLVSWENKIRPQLKDGTDHPQADAEISKLDDLYNRIDVALKEFGETQIYSWIENFRY